MMHLVQLTLRQARRVVVAVIGTTVILIGVIMLVTPGPAFVVIPAGIAILATEFVWARRLLRRIKDSAKSALASVSSKSAGAVAGTDDSSGHRTP